MNLASSFPALDFGVVGSADESLEGGGLFDATPSPGSDSPYVFAGAGGVPGERDCVSNPNLLAGG